MRSLALTRWAMSANLESAALSVRVGMPSCMDIVQTSTKLSTRSHNGCFIENEMRVQPQIHARLLCKAESKGGFVRPDGECGRYLLDVAEKAKQQLGGMLFLQALHETHRKCEQHARHTLYRTHTRTPHSSFTHTHTHLDCPVETLVSIHAHIAVVVSTAWTAAIQL